MEAAIRYCLKDCGNKFQSNIKEIRSYMPLIDPLAGKQLYDWQEEILTMTEGEPDDRKIHWFWEEIGCSGKTSLAKHMCITRRDCIYVSGKACDVKHGIVSAGKPVKTVIWDLTRTNEQFVSYQGIEEVKNGIFYTTKYESKQFMMNPPWIIIFANFGPQEDKLSLDRWVIKKIN